MSKGNPTIGDTLCVLVAPEGNNGSQVAAAIITRVWAPDNISVRILRDVGGEVELREGVVLAENEALANHVAYTILSQHDTTSLRGREQYTRERKHLTVAFWPDQPAPVDSTPEPQPAPAPVDAVPPAPVVDQVSASPADPFADQASPAVDVVTTPSDPFAQPPGE